jgi:hypothetical protein
MLSLLDDTKWVWLDGFKKVVYIKNHCFLKKGHKYHGKLYLRFYGDFLEDDPLRRDVIMDNMCLKW